MVKDDLKKLYFDFNAGYCSYGAGCRFDHRCSFCLKFGHGSFNCRKAAQKGGNNNNGKGNQSANMRGQHMPAKADNNMGSTSQAK